MNSQENDSRVASNIKTISNGRKVGGDYFKLIYSRCSKLYLKDYIDQFNFDDYYCFKSTNTQRLISEEDFLDFKYSGYIFFRKDLYDIENILEWCKWCSEFGGNGGIQYLSKPTPPFSPTKIKIKK